jgi:hypothetical protein
MRFSLFSPNGQFGCLTLAGGQFILTVGFLPSTFGADFSNARGMVWAFPRDQRL